jgi:hypothetical protein
MGQGASPSRSSARARSCSGSSFASSRDKRWFFDTELSSDGGVSASGVDGVFLLTSMTSHASADAPIVSQFVGSDRAEGSPLKRARGGFWRELVNRPYKDRPKEVNPRERGSCLWRLCGVSPFSGLALESVALPRAHALRFPPLPLARLCFFSPLTRIIFVLRLRGYSCC